MGPSQLRDMIIFYILLDKKQLTTMKMFHIDQFKCTLCENWFCPPFNLPYLLPCSHSVCTHCVKKSADSGQIICPQDFEVNDIRNINLNISTKKALERLMKQHKNYNQNAQLECIKTLSVSFDQILNNQQKSIHNLKLLIDKVFQTEIDRIKGIYEKVKLQLMRPFNIVNDWKQIVSVYLTSLKKISKSLDSVNLTQLNHYIEEGRKIKLDLNDFFQINFDECADSIILTPNQCFKNDFSMRYCCSQNRSSMNTGEKRSYKKAGVEKFMTFDSEPTLEEDKIKKMQNDLLIEARKRQSINTLKNDPIRPRNIAKQNIRAPLRPLNANTTPNSPPITTRDANFHSTSKQIIDSDPDYLHQYIREASNYKQSSSNFAQERFSKKKEKQEENVSNLSHFQIGEHENIQYARSYEGDNPLTYRQNNHLQMRRNIGDKENRNSQSLYSSKGMEGKKERQRKCLEIKERIVTQEQGNQEEQMLLNTDRDQWSMGNINFLKQWQLGRKKIQQFDLEIRQKDLYNCEREKVTYMRRMQMVRAQELLKSTLVKQNSLELINCSLHDIDLNLYLSSFDWNKIEIVKLVRVSLIDQQLNTILNYILKSPVKVLVLSSNSLTDLCLDAFLHFVSVNSMLKNVYLSKNNISILRCKQKIQLLKDKGINIYI